MGIVTEIRNMLYVDMLWIGLVIPDQDTHTHTH